MMTYKVSDGEMVMNRVEADSESQAIQLVAESFGYEDMEAMSADGSVELSDIRAEAE